MGQFLIATWRAGLRGRGVLAVLVVGVLTVAVAYLSASFSPRQPKTVALDVGFSGLRFGLVLFALYWVQELITREVERRTVSFSLTYPVGRGDYLVGRYVGILGLLALAASLLGLLLWLSVLMAGSSYEQGFPVVLGEPYWATVAALWLDASVVAAFTLLIATLSTVPMLPVALGVAFAIGGKSLGPVADYLASGADQDQTLVATYQPAINIIRYVLPDLSRLDWREWPMYGVAPPSGVLGISLAMAFGYLLVLVGLAVVTFRRREFA